MRNAFVRTDRPNPHIQRGRDILKRHPEVRTHFTTYPPSGAYIAAIVAAQVGIGYALREASWVWIVLCAYLVGAFASHALFVLIHEAAHDLIVRRSWPNRLFGILCNVGQGFPTAMSFRTFHLLHHYHLDEYSYDADLAFDWEARLVGNSPLRKAVWRFLFGAIRSCGRCAEAAVHRNWTIGSGGVVVTDFLLWRFCGVRGVDLHVLSRRW